MYNMYSSKIFNISIQLIIFMFILHLLILLFIYITNFSFNNLTIFYRKYFILLNSDHWFSD